MCVARRVIAAFQQQKTDFHGPGTRTLRKCESTEFPIFGDVGSLARNALGERHSSLL